MAAAVLSVAAQELVPGRIYASVYSADSWKEHQLEEIGLYSFSPQEYERQTVMQDPYLDASGGGAMTDDFYFATTAVDFGFGMEITHRMFNPYSWAEKISYSGVAQSVATDMTYDPISSKIYGCFQGDAGGYVFGTLDMADGYRFKIADLQTPWLACSVDRNGTLYAIDMAGALMRVDKTNGSSTLIGQTGLSSKFSSSGAIDPATGIFYVATLTDRRNPDPYLSWKPNVSKLYAVDLATASATFLYELADGEALCGMFIPGPAAEQGAPAQVESLSVEFHQDSLSGTANFSIPSLTFGGSTLEGEVGYLLQANGSLLAEGKALPGTALSLTVKVAEAGEYELLLTLRNRAGRSPRTRMVKWIGPDTPEPISNLRLSYSEPTATLTWDAPSRSTHGGWFNPSAITYTVVRQPMGTVVATNLTSTSFSETLPMPEQLQWVYYEVQTSYPVASGEPQPAMLSNRHCLGALPLPYHSDFSQEESLLFYTRIDSNADRAEWYREWEWWIDPTEELVAAVAYPFSSTLPADDWLILPPLRLTEGHTYRLTCEPMVASADTPERLAVKLGAAPTPEALTHSLMPPTEFANPAPETREMLFKAPASGIHYIGFHACSDANASGLALRSIALTDLGAASVAAPVSESLTAVPISGGVALTLSSPLPYRVFTPSGTLVAEGRMPAGTTRLSLPAALYILRAGEHTVKFTVR